MTDEEKAVVFIKRYWGHYTEEFRNAMIPPLVRLIQEEREACAQLLEMSADRWESEGNLPRAENLRAHAGMIRARPTPPQT